MKLEIKDDTVIFYPENDYDVYRLGSFDIIQKTANFESYGRMVNVSITVKDLINFIFKTKNNLYNTF